MASACPVSCQAGPRQMNAGMGIAVGALAPGPASPPRGGNAADASTTDFHPALRQVAGLALPAMIGSARLPCAAGTRRISH